MQPTRSREQRRGRLTSQLTEAARAGSTVEARQVAIPLGPCCRSGHCCCREHEQRPQGAAQWRPRHPAALIGGVVRPPWEKRARLQLD